MTFTLLPRTDEEVMAHDGLVFDLEQPGFSDRFSAQVEQDRIREDHFGRAAQIEQDLVEEIQSQIPDYVSPPDRGDVDPNAPDARILPNFAVPWENRHDWLFEGVRRAREANPQAFGNLPADLDSFQLELARRRRAEWDDAETVLGAAPGGGWLPEFLGSTWAAVSTPEGALLAALGGVAGGGSVLATAAYEGVLGAVDEALRLPDQFTVSEELDTPRPEPVRQVLTAGIAGAVIGGGIAGAVKGAKRFVEYRRARSDAEKETRPEGVDPTDDAERVAAARETLERGQTPVQSGTLAEILNDPDQVFDWTPHRIDGGLRPDAISGMTPALRGGLEAMIQSAPERIREGFQVYSGYRSPEVQARLWKEALAKYGTPAKARKWVAPPGNSYHNKGQAADLKWKGQRLDKAPADVRQWIHQNAHRFGLHFPLGNEPWHIEALGTRGTKPARARDAAPGKPLAMADFDFSDTGNASPTQNRIGYVFGRLLEKGYEPHQAAGLIGNLIQESGPGLDTHAIGDGGNAIGMAQHNGPRMDALKAFATARGKDWTDLDTQIDFIDHELRTTESAAGAALRNAPDAATAARIASEQFWRPGVPRLGQRMGYAEDIMQFYSDGYVPRWGGVRPAATSGGGGATFEGYTQRGYTGTGQVLVGDGTRLDVDYEVVDLSSLSQASGNLQPRDRDRIASDAWVNDTAARLDPALLMPSPTADRGAPLVGPDNVIESGNGRVRALERAFARFEDRAAAYRQQIEAAGFDVPEGVERPVLIARRKTELDAASRQQMVVDAQDSGVARMTATERAQIGQRALSADRLTKFDPAKKITDPENRDFARDFAGAFPRSERNAFLNAEGRISIDGIRQVQDSLFARAWSAPDIVARAIEAEPGELRSLVDALQAAAPDMAILRAEIDAGLVRPEMDITGHVLEAARIIMAARDAATQGGKVADIIEDMLADVSLFGDSVAPLTAALVRKMAPGGRQAPAKALAQFLGRYAAEARKAGRTGDALDPVGPLDVLKRLDKDAFGDLTEIGELPRPPAEPVPAPRAPEPAAIPDGAFADGASSPELEPVTASALDDLRALVADNPDLDLTNDEGFTQTARAVLDDLEADETLEAAIDACLTGRAG